MLGKNHRLARQSPPGSGGRNQSQKVVWRLLLAHQKTWTGGHFRVLWDGFLMASMFRSIDISGPSHPRALGTASLPKLRSSADSATTDCCSLSQDARSTSGDGRIRSSFRADSARVERADCWVGDLWQLDHRTRLNLHQALDLLQMNWCLEQYKYFRVDFYQISGMVSSKKHWQFFCMGAATRGLPHELATMQQPLLSRNSFNSPYSLPNSAAGAPKEVNRSPIEPRAPVDSDLMSLRPSLVSTAKSGHKWRKM